MHFKKIQSKKAIERLIGVNRAKCNTNYKLLQLQIVKEVQDFIERDEFSRCCPGKKDTVTKNKLKKQKRLLNKPLKEIHQEFIKQSSTKISYSLFCRLKPFWVLEPKIEARNTCMCKTWSNMSMLHSRLHLPQVIDEEASVVNLVSTLCCSEERKEECLLRDCKNCAEKITLYNDSITTDTTWLCKWVTQKRYCCKRNE